jgi:hypothetical protein
MTLVVRSTVVQCGCILVQASTVTTEVPAGLEHILHWIAPYEVLDTALVRHEQLEVYSLSLPCSWHSYF